jgi:hypothetical protein
MHGQNFALTGIRPEGTTGASPDLEKRIFDRLGLGRKLPITRLLKQSATIALGGRNHIPRQRSAG